MVWSRWSCSRKLASLKSDKYFMILSMVPAGKMLFISKLLRLACNALADSTHDEG